ncbi:MAG TPA: glycerophosphodiester phosphodiesterase, partial [Kofleriaceae bacterium]|nr:glycerophosphodiester phosphodiesterase [Kofleriaceae bacterium]
IKDSGRGDHILISSFDPVALVQFHRRDPDIALAYLFHGEQSLPLRRGWAGRVAGASLFHPHHALCTEDSVRAWHTAGLPVNAWTVDDATELVRLAAIGIDGVFANDVAHAVAVLGAM